MRSVAAVVGLTLASVLPCAGQVPLEGEVRQLVTFSLLPGSTPEVVDIYRERALPLYRENDAMRSVRVFREVESPVPLDLVVVSAFDGMAGMDRSNDALRSRAEAMGTDIGTIYGEIAGLARFHTDELVEMLPALGGGDPSATALTVFVRYRVAPDAADAVETALIRLAAWERSSEIPVATGRFLLSDGWDYLRILGFESLGAFEAYRREAELERGYRALTESTTRRQEIILGRMDELRVR